jgi:hypothetical protein
VLTRIEAQARLVRAQAHQDAATRAGDDTVPADSQVDG